MKGLLNRFKGLTFISSDVGSHEKVLSRGVTWSDSCVL